MPLNLSSLKPLLDKADDLGDRKDWNVSTTGAEVKFNEKVAHIDAPTLIVDLPNFTDPAPQDLVTTQKAALQSATTAAAVKQLIDATVAANQAYFNADEVKDKGNNQRFGVQHLRREAFFTALSSALKGGALPANERAKLGLVLVESKEALIAGRAFDMEVGKNHNYWPYWKNFVGVLEKMLAQVSESHPSHAAIKARIEDIYNRKHVSGWGRSVREHDIERSIGMTIVHRPIGSKGVGHRVSLHKDSQKGQPIYETLAVPKSGLPSGFEAYAGAKVVRAAAGKLSFDFEGPNASPNRTGEAVPEALVALIEASPVPAQDLGLRPLVANESARDNMPWDWNRSGQLDIAAIDISWWGHCHNEAPANTLGLNPKHALTWFRAGENGQPTTFSTDDQWDVVGNLMADRERGYSSGANAVDLDVTTFVGDRNNGGHDASFSVEGRSRPIQLDFEVTAWFSAKTGEQYDDALKGFRHNLESDDGLSFSKNELLLGSNGDMITKSGLGRQMAATVTYVDLGADGYPTQQKAYVDLDPKQDGFVCIGAQVLSRPQGLSGKGQVEEFFFNPKTQQLQTRRVSVEGDGTGAFTRVEGELSAPAKVTGFGVRQETTYDSVKQIHEFATHRPGLPFVFDTTPGMAVWNYPVKFLRIDQKSRTERDGFVYTRYALSYATEGGPSGNAEYIVKRDQTGAIVDTCALDPMPDFAYRQDQMKMGAIAVDAHGTPRYNLSAFENGSLVDADGTLAPSLAMYERQLKLLYASLTATQESYIYEADDGRLYRFTSKADYDALVSARQALEAQPA